MIPYIEFRPTFCRMDRADTNDELGDINLGASFAPHIECYVGHIGS